MINSPLNMSECLPKEILMSLKNNDIQSCFSKLPYLSNNKSNEKFMFELKQAQTMNHLTKLRSKDGNTKSPTKVNFRQKSVSISKNESKTPDYENLLIHNKSFSSTRERVKFNILRNSLKLMHYDKETGNLIHNSKAKRFGNPKLVANEVKRYVEKAKLLENRNSTNHYHIEKNLKKNPSLMFTYDEDLSSERDHRSITVMRKPKRIDITVELPPFKSADLQSPRSTKSNSDEIMEKEKKTIINEESREDENDKPSNIARKGSLPCGTIKKEPKRQKEKKTIPIESLRISYFDIK